MRRYYHYKSFWEMTMRRNLLNTSIVVFVLVLVLSWFFHGTGVVKNDLRRNLYIPETITMPLQVKAAYDGERMFFRYRWPARLSFHWRTV